MSDFEQQMLYHCAPALSGIKQANLFSLPLSQFSSLRDEVVGYQKNLAKKHISLQILYCCGKRVFFLLYRQEELLAYLKNDQVQQFLLQEGYPPMGEKTSLSPILANLRRRIVQYKDFPHEIGFFLGYPMDDVFAFIQEKGQNYKLCGYWKVYGDESHAKECFRQYTLCRNELMEKALKGNSILSLLKAV